MPTVTIAARKGGVGKTMTALMTARWLARAGRDCTLVDLDPQRGLWDCATVLGCPDGKLTRRLRLAADGAIPQPPTARHYTIVDTPPATDGLMPGLQAADYIVVPVIPEAQEMLALGKFLDVLDATRHDRPFARTLGVLPVRYVHHWRAHRECLLEVRCIAADHGIDVLDPVPHSQAVTRYSMAGGLWRSLAMRLMALEPSTEAPSQAA
jgi:cellulose biosynthesis protein BcsQ